MKVKKIIPCVLMTVLSMTIITATVFADNKDIKNNKIGVATNISVKEDKIDSRLNKKTIDVDGREGVVRDIEKPLFINGGYCKVKIDNNFFKEGNYLIRGRENGSTFKIFDEDGNVIQDYTSVEFSGEVVEVKLGYSIELNDANADRIYFND